MNIDVVIIDEDGVILFLHKILVRKSDLSGDIFEFKDASDALNFLLGQWKSPQPILILLDINMPGMSGWEFLERLQDEAPKSNIFVVVVTSSINSSDRQKAMQYPLVLDYLEKPLSKTDCSNLHCQLKIKLQNLSS